MKKTEMLKKNYEFRNILSKGKFFRGKEIEIFILRNNKKRNFLGIAIGTKSGKATQRNRAKRIIRECYSKIEEQLENGYSMVVVMNKKFSIDNLNFLEVLNDMINIFKKSKILKIEDEK